MFSSVCEVGLGYIILKLRGEIEKEVMEVIAIYTSTKDTGMFEVHLAKVQSEKMRT